MKAVLKTGTELELLEASFSKNFIILCKNKAEYLEKWDAMTEAALKEVAIYDEDIVIFRMQNIHLDGTQAVNNPDGTITAHFYFHGESLENTSLEDRIFAEAGKMVLDGDATDAIERAAIIKEEYDQAHPKEEADIVNLSDVSK